MRIAHAALAAAVVLASASQAFAHARVLATVPRDNALLAGSPPAIEIRFNEILDDDFNSIEVFSEAQPAQSPTSLTAGPATVDAKDGTHLVAPLQKLPPGTYAVHWKVLSRDGHTARGRFTFRVLPDRDGAY
jgi:methionine-rich copper-binding protein CopC